MMRSNRKQLAVWWWIQRAACLSGVAAATLSCSGDSKPSPIDPASDAAYFDAARRVEISVELAPSDWELLREEGRSLSSFFDLTQPFEYTYFDAAVTIDGRRYEQVQVRKKGFLGSLSALRSKSIWIAASKVKTTLVYAA